MRGTGLFAATIALSSCSLIVDTSGLSGGAAVDASVDAAPEGATDAPLDAFDADVAMPADAPSDADADSALGFCPPFAFCDSFERSTPQGLWQVPAGSDATLAIDGTTAREGAASLRVDLATSTGSSEVTLNKDVMPAIAGVITTSYSIRLASAPTRDVHFCALYTKSPTRYVFVNITQAGALQVIEQDPGAAVSKTYGVGSLTFGAWHDIRLELVAAATSTVKFFVDGVERLSQLLMIGMTSTSYTFKLGVTFSTPGPAMPFLFDAVAVEY